MKKIIYGLMLCLSMAVFTGCEDETSQDMSKITYYATLELKGDKLIMWSLGTPFVEPGYESVMQGEDVSDQVVVDGTVDANTPGIYNLTYSITNPDGFAVTDSRTVMVAYPSQTFPAGYWHTDATNYRSVPDSEGNPVMTVYGASYEVLFLPLSETEFYVADFLGGYYAQRAGYGSDYAMSGHFKLNPDNTLTLVDSSLAGWGDSLVGLTNGTWDPATSTFSWCANYVENMDFYVTLTK